MTPEQRQALKQAVDQARRAILTRAGNDDGRSYRQRKDVRLGESHAAVVKRKWRASGGTVNVQTHGTNGGYRSGCRCDECRQGAREYRRRKRQEAAQ